MTHLVRPSYLTVKSGLNFATLTVSLITLVMFSLFYLLQKEVKAHSKEIVKSVLVDPEAEFKKEVEEVEQSKEDPKDSEDLTSTQKADLKDLR